jgi:tetratricopeptide (TPR) repeat protein
MDAARLVERAHELLSAGRSAEAAPLLQRALELDPGLAPVHTTLGHVLRELGQPQAAAESCARAIELEPGLAAAHSNLGNALLELGRIAEAEASYRRALNLVPDLAEVHSNLAKLLLDAGRVEESISSARRALQLAPRLAAAHQNLADALLNVNVEQAVLHYRAALETGPADAQLHTSLGIALRLLGRTAEAEASLRRALELVPDHAPAIATLAEARADRGDFEAAEPLFRRALSLQPDLADAWIGLSRLRRFTPADIGWLQHAEALAARSNRPREVAALLYAIGKYHDDLGHYDDAFDSYRRANEVSRRIARPYDRVQVERQTDALIAAHDRIVPIDAAASGECALLIVGMPRSGTSLAEQILASHPLVRGAGELTFWHSAAASLAGARGDDESVRRFGADYVRLLERIAVGASRVVDKMPTNFLELGLIGRALSGFRVIHMQRDPIDTCLSIYFQDFRSTFAYANDLDDLAHFYSEYARLMSHWRRVLPPGVLLEVPYEALVNDQEGWTRRMLAFAGLPWDARCLEFHQTERSVVTASKWQVRQTLNRSSVARWRRYETHIGPLLRLSGLVTSVLPPGRSEGSGSQ